MGSGMKNLDRLRRDLQRRQLWAGPSRASGRLRSRPCSGRSRSEQRGVNRARTTRPRRPTSLRARSGDLPVQSGGPSHIDLWDHKPHWDRLHGQPIPPSVLGTQRVTGMTAGQSQFLTNRPIRPFRRHGDCGRWVSELLPHTAGVVDDLAVLKAVHTEAINHDPGITLINTGDSQVGKASLGAWLSYGLGSENEDLPAYTVLISQGNGKNPGQPIFSRLWGSGFLPSEHQGVRLRAGRAGDAPREQAASIAGSDASSSTLSPRLTDTGRGHGRPGDRGARRPVRDGFPMQASVPASPISPTSPSHLRPLRQTAAGHLRGQLPDGAPDDGARRALRAVAPPGVGPAHRSRPALAQCRDTDRASAALVTDLKWRGHRRHPCDLGRGVGRTAYSQGRLDPGRDHHGRCFTVRWPAAEEGRRRARGHRRLQLQRCGRRRARARPQRHDPAPARDRPRTPHVQVPGTLPTPRAWSQRGWCARSSPECGRLRGALRVRTLRSARARLQAVEHTPIDPPRTLAGRLREIGPGIIVSGAIVGSGELIVTTKLGAEAGFVLLWLILFSCVIKVFLQIELGRYVVSSGHTVLEAFDRVPGGDPHRRGPAELDERALVRDDRLRRLPGRRILLGLALVFQMLALVSGAPGWSGHGLRPAGGGAALVGQVRPRGARPRVSSGSSPSSRSPRPSSYRGRTRPSPARTSRRAHALDPTRRVPTALAVLGITGGGNELIFYPYWCLEKGYAWHAGPADGSAEWLVVRAAGFASCSSTHGSPAPSAPWARSPSTCSAPLS